MSPDPSPYLGWIAAPLSQSATLLGMFWHAYWGRDTLNQKALNIQHMGTFPVNARILAYYFKARWYLESSKGMVGRGRNEKRMRALRLFVQCIEEGSAYEGSVDLLIPPLGLVYYHLWEIVNEEQDKVRRGQSFINTLQREAGLSGEQDRYLEEEYCRTRAQMLLHRMVGRHNAGSAYFEWVRQRYYLQDGFADNYTNVAWAVDYALIPVAERMLKELRE